MVMMSAVNKIPDLTLKMYLENMMVKEVHTFMSKSTIESNIFNSLITFVTNVLNVKIPTISFLGQRP